MVVANSKPIAPVAPAFEDEITAKSESVKKHKKEKKEKKEDEQVEESEEAKKERKRKRKEEKKAAKLAQKEKEEEQEKEKKEDGDADEKAAKKERKRKRREEKEKAKQQEEQKKEDEEEAPKKKKHKKHSKSSSSSDTESSSSSCGSSAASTPSSSASSTPCASPSSSMTAAQAAKIREERDITIEGTGSETAKFYPLSSFADAKLPETVYAVCKKFAKPTPIQCQALPVVMSGRDAVGIAETGSGKTLAFLLPAFVHIQELKKKTHGNTNKPFVLVIAPTRELAQQIADTAEAAKDSTGVRSVCVYGGVPVQVHRQAFRSNKVDLVVATPGRLQQLMDEGAIDLSQVSYLVLDEADRCLDMGFLPSIRSIVEACSCATRQTIMFSATWPTAVKLIAADFMKDPIKIVIGSASLSANKRVNQIVEVVDLRGKDRRLIDLLNKYHKSRTNRIIIFVLYKKEAERVERMIQQKGFSVAGIHGDKNQTARNHALAEFRSGKCPLLVATDVAARGLDIPQVSHVLNYTMPLTIEDYVHRIGRTARAGEVGVAHTLFTELDKHHSGELVGILREANQEVPEALLAFGTATKKKEHALYGCHFKNLDDKPMKEATHVTFDDDDE